MYIKQIIIQGFKSYKEQTEIAPFSSKDNVIVGKNGSGKSNFFAAVRFVLGDSYTQMSREERNALLHEGSGSAVMSAYVEVIFDNSDDRFPTGKPETILRRTIGIKKDEYSIDRKNSTKSEVMSLLESAGFSRSNPYYIVPQGRITALTSMKDQERLALLKDVAGTQVYEARRQESLKILTETENKQSQIDGLLKVIRERLDELEQEKEELSEYQSQDRERRVLEYTFHSRELQKVTQQLENLEDRRLAKADENEERARQAEEVAQEMGDIQKEIQHKQERINILNDDRKQCDADYRAAKSDQTRSRLEIDASKEGQAETDQVQKDLARKLNSIEANIKNHEKELKRILPEYNDVKEQELAVKSQIDTDESIQRRLRGKQQYSSKNERDAALMKQAEGIQVDLGRRKANASHNADVIAELEETIATLESEVETIQSNLAAGQDNAQQYPETVAKLEKEIAELDDERKGVLREESTIYNQIKTAEEDLSHATHVLSKLTDRNTINGINAVRRMQASGEIDGIYGTLAELIKVKEGYKVAAEVIGGQSFFNVVVDTDETANKIIKELQERRLGRITAMPLNRVHNKETQFPKVNDAMPLISKLGFDPEFKPAVEHIFGKTIVCPGMNVAGDYARNHGLTAVDIHGNRADKKGAFTGGWFDPSKSRLNAIHNEKKAHANLEELLESRKKLEKSKESISQRITKKKGEQNKADVDRAKAERDYRTLQEGLQSRLQQVPAKQNELEQKKLKQQEDSSEYSRLDDELTSLQNEAEGPFQPKLTKDEIRQLENLNSNVPKLKKQYVELNTRRNDLESQKTGLEFELKQNLRPLWNQLKASDLGDSANAFGAQSKLQEAGRKLQRATAAVKSTRKLLDERDKELESVNRELSGLQNALAEKEQEQNELQEEIEKYNKRLANSHSERSTLTLRAENCKRAIDELGTLPSNSNEQKYRKWDPEKITKRLKQIRDTLKKYTHVNKKAVEQYNNFTVQREKLTKRRTELDSSYSSIQELIEHLDQRKDEAIERTFRQVSKEFAWVFERLVPAGRGRLVIQRKTDRQIRREEDDSEGERDPNNVQNYTGVGISVSFNSKHDEQQRVQQLSGGQKSLCALALVFAIQRCDPAPFYIFDEIDANLDAQYRTAVANMIKRLSDPQEEDSVGGQFICTTFSRELIVEADKCYLVTFSNKTSSIDVVYKEHALQFVEDQKRSGAQ